jgi:hypothetical protein
MVLFEKSVEDLVKKGQILEADARSFLGKEASPGMPGTGKKVA